MAEVSLIRHDCMDDSDEGFEQGDCPTGSLEEDAALPMLVRLQKYAQSTNMFHRRMVVRMIQKLFRTVPDDVLVHDLPEIMKILTKIGEESILRADILEQIPHIAAQAVEYSSRVPALKGMVNDYLLPLVVRNLEFSDTAVDKAAQATLFHLVEQGFITKLQVEIKVCPAILALSKLELAITLMSKLAPFLGRDVTERVFLDRFTELCTNNMFLVRKACATELGHFCAVIGPAAFEKKLLPCYIALCNDTIWGVRKSCAEKIMFLSCVCPPLLRKELLAPVCDKLLRDEIKWVRMAAFQALGPFLSTFADPPVTRMGYNKMGELVLINSRGGEFVMNCSLYSTTAERYSMSGEKELANLVLEDDIIKKEEENTSVNVIDEKRDNYCNINRIMLTDSMKDFDVRITKLIHSCIDHETSTDKMSSITKECNEDEETKVNTENTLLEDDDLHLFNSYNYWYISPDLPLDPSLISDPDCVEKKNCSSDVALNNLENLYAAINLNETTNDSTPNSSTISLDDEKAYINEEEEVDGSEEPPQTIVPQYLINHFVSMTDPVLHLNIDNEMTYHCAYSLPAVALTLGSENWPLLKGTVECLASDMQYKVRRTLASGLHELALILGPDLTTTDLTPLFDGFLKDLDEVRIGVLKHLAQFLELLSPAKRNTYLPRLSDFLQIDNIGNWRFREELGKQLLEAVSLFKPLDTSKYIGIIAIDLLCDKIAAVRTAALSLVTEIIRYTSLETTITASLLVKLAEHFAHSKKWKRRQTFCLLCIELLKEKAVTSEQFASEVMPHLLDLSWDPVANVRLVVARCLSKHITRNDYFMNATNENCGGIETVLKLLLADKDRDVRQSAEF